ncbi:MAG: SDR family NAD(P)-dependent oxidoreductase [Gammaproteobacteria bacterium]|nr:SDR family NAD(P)-dependent oxidoreductase [Gammaproteobacteria bacterium]
MSGKIILITGANGGLGSALAKQCAKAGHTVILLGRNIAKLEKVYDEIEAEGGATPAIYPLDLAGATAHDYGEMAQRITEQLGGVDLLVHAAATLGNPSPVELIEPEHLNKVLAINLVGPTLLTQALIPTLRQRKGTVVFTQDNADRAYWGCYAISKGGLAQFANVVAAENDDITVHQFHPGIMRTPLRAGAFPGENPTELPSPELAATRLMELINGA